VSNWWIPTSANWRETRRRRLGSEEEEEIAETNEAPHADGPISGAWGARFQDHLPNTGCLPSEQNGVRYYVGRSRSAG